MRIIGIATPDESIEQLNNNNILQTLDKISEYAAPTFKCNDRWKQQITSGKTKITEGNINDMTLLSSTSNCKGSLKFEE